MQHARELEPLQPMDHALSAHLAPLARDCSAGFEFARHATVVEAAFGLDTSRLPGLMSAGATWNWRSKR